MIKNTEGCDATDGSVEKTRYLLQQRRIRNIPIAIFSLTTQLNPKPMTLNSQLTQANIVS